MAPRNELFRVKKPHTRFFQELIKLDETYINDKGSGLYMLRLSKRELNDVIGMSRRGVDKWVMYKKNPFTLELDGSKYNSYRRRKRR